MFSWTFVMVVHRFDYIIYNPLHKTYRHRHRHSHAWGIYDMVDRFLLKRFHLSAYSVHPFPMIPLNICHRFAVHCVCHIANKCVLGPSATHTHTQQHNSQSHRHADRTIIITGTLIHTDLEKKREKHWKNLQINILTMHTEEEEEVTANCRQNAACEFNAVFLPWHWSWKWFTYNV